jgi:N-carbamoylputrescine amidase
LIGRAAQGGGQVVLLPELVLHDYFCIEEDIRHFDLAHGLDAQPVRELQEQAKKLGIALVLPFFEKRAAGLYHNSAAVFDADGSLAGLYRKMHIPHDPGFNEKYYFAPGDLGFQSIATRHGSLGVLICWDQWFPEGARLTALQGCEVLLYPTAIGWDDAESVKLPLEAAQALEARHLDAWITVQRSHAIANGVYVAAPNRVGREGDVQFWGSSFVADPYGNILARASQEEEETLIIECDFDLIDTARTHWPFFRDRRIDAYSPMTRRWTDRTSQ